MGWSLAWGSNTRAAIRGDGTLPASEVSAAPARDPDTRTMEIALGGRPDDSAKIVCSRGCIVYLAPSPLKRQRNFDLPQRISCKAEGRRQRRSSAGAFPAAIRAIMLRKSPDSPDRSEVG